MSTTLTIAKRELRSSFDSPLAYVVICLGLLLLGGVLFLYYDYWQRDLATLRELFDAAPRGLAVVVVPVVTMRLLAEEKRSGTLEMLITLPVRDHEVILGKFLGAWGLVLVLIASTAIFPIMMFKWPWNLGDIDAGPIFSGYLGLVLYSAAAVSIGLLISALTESQVIAFFMTFFTLAVLSLVGLLTKVLGPGRLSDVIMFVAFDARIAPFSSGQINSRDVIYFLSITVGCLMAAFRALERRKWA